MVWNVRLLPHCNTPFLPRVLITTTTKTASRLTQRHFKPFHGKSPAVLPVYSPANRPLIIENPRYVDIWRSPRPKGDLIVWYGFERIFGHSGNGLGPKAAKDRSRERRPGKLHPNMGQSRISTPVSSGQCVISTPMPTSQSCPRALCRLARKRSERRSGLSASRPRWLPFAQSRSPKRR